MTHGLVQKMLYQYLCWTNHWRMKSAYVSSINTWNQTSLQDQMAIALGCSTYYQHNGLLFWHFCSVLSSHLHLIRSLGPKQSCQCSSRKVAVCFQETTVGLVWLTASASFMITSWTTDWLLGTYHSVSRQVARRREAVLNMCWPWDCGLIFVSVNEGNCSLHLSISPRRMTVFPGENSSLYFWAWVVELLCCAP